MNRSELRRFTRWALLTTPIVAVLRSAWCGLEPAHRQPAQHSQEPMAGLLSTAGSGGFARTRRRAEAAGPGQPACVRQHHPEWSGGENAHSGQTARRNGPGGTASQATIAPQWPRDSVGEGLTN
jgi:hypothetical protein